MSGSDTATEQQKIEAKPPRLGRARAFVTLVVVAGAAAFGWLSLNHAPDLMGAYSEFWLLAGLVVLGELLPVKISGPEGDYYITTSAIFAFAILLKFGITAAVFTLAGISLAVDIRDRRPWWKAAFNTAQLTLTLTASGLTLQAFTQSDFHGIPHFGTAEIPAILIASAVFFGLNSLMLRMAIALHNNSPIGRTLLSGLGYHLSVEAALLALAPAVVVAGERSLVLVPLLALPMAIVYKSATVYAEKEFKTHLALHDTLTGLPNRSLLYDRVEQAIALGERSGKQAAVLLIDLDRFKEVNDSLGHHIGDLLLQKVGPRLKANLRGTDTIARLGGDEFAVVLPEIADEKSASLVAAKIAEELERPFVLEEVSEELTLNIEGSIGIALYPDHGRDVDTLIQRADVAMYLAKEAHTRFEFYSNERDRHSAKELALIGELRRAMEAEELYLLYQPKIDVRTGLVSGVEALIRWQHPKRGVVPPDEFIPSAERTGIIQPLTMYTLVRAMRDWRRWREQGRTIRVAVNISKGNLLNLSFPEEVQKLLETWEMDPRYLELEITESMIMADPIRAAEVLQKLSDMGVRLSLDDFGVGYSSLAYLKRLPVSEIKIDKSFVIGMAQDENDSAIVKSTIDLGRNLGLMVVGEGVETAEVLDLLHGLGCDMAQGFFLGRPMAGRDLSSWVAHFEASEFVAREMSAGPADEDPGSAEAAPAAATS